MHRFLRLSVPPVQTESADKHRSLQTNGRVFAVTSSWSREEGGGVKNKGQKTPNNKKTQNKMPCKTKPQRLGRSSGLFHSQRVPCGLVSPVKGKNQHSAGICAAPSSSTPGLIPSTLKSCRHAAKRGYLALLSQCRRSRGSGSRTGNRLSGYGSCIIELRAPPAL